ncbi:hypothetical protein CKO15_10850 [Halorhodospira abdelmalekii]|nr:hypothetical protein [Halorhodospira abdelmalekii]
MPSDPRHCQRCALCHHRSQVVLPDGPQRSVLAVGEAPGAEEDRQGVGFAGIAGTNLDRAFERAGVARSDYARANVVRCRPPNNRPPKRAEVEACAPYLEEAIKALDPVVILAVGRSAAKRLMPEWVRCGSYLEICEAQLARRLEVGRGPMSYFGRSLLLMPHSSPLAWNRTYRRADGSEGAIRELGEQVVAVAAALARDRAD